MTSGVYPRKTTEERFKDKYEVNTTSGCWEWTASLFEGYGQFYYSGTMGRAHRYSYETYVGSIPKDKVLDHKCRVTYCCNPNHLEPVTQKVNVRRGDAGKTCKERAKKQTHCKWGHVYTKESTYITPSGTRNCRICHKERERKRRLLKVKE